MSRLSLLDILIILALLALLLFASRQDFPRYEGRRVLPPSDPTSAQGG